jgi:pyruvate dehydrogenase E2 component (dihydrolipoamide acetyltransferase)
VAAAAAPAPAPAAAAAAPSVEGGYKDIPHTNMRKVIAERLLQSKNTIPHYYITVECEMDSLLAYVCRAPMLLLLLLFYMGESLLIM